jgi:hypothetical protein
VQQVNSGAEVSNDEIKACLVS